MKLAAHGLGRVPSPPDPRDASYTAERLAAMEELGLAAPVSWRNVNRVLDQGTDGTCVAAGTLGLLNTDDERHNDPRFTNVDILPFFLKIPGHGPLPAGGACIRDGLKVAMAAGFVAAYALLRSDAEIDEWLAHHGPVLVGSHWMAGMMKPSGGIVSVGRIRRKLGHCYFWHGQDSVYRLGTNSWGTDWAELGRFKMLRRDDRRLRAAGGEAWAVLQPVGGS